jgi:hypothetical protein
MLLVLYSLPNMLSKRDKQRLKARLKRITIEQTKRWLDECDRLLDDAGIPKHVCLVDDTVPENSTPSRLKWFLLRRKSVQRWETDNLDNEMKLAEQEAKNWEIYV